MSARREQVDAARRRTIARRVDRLVDHPSKRRVADQLATSLVLLAGDELEVLEHMIARHDGDLWCTTAVVARLLRGRGEYGELVIDDDPRDFAAERDEELADAEVYRAMADIRARRDGRVPQKLRGGAAALERVGQRLANQLATLTERAMARGGSR